MDIDQLPGRTVNFRNEQFLYFSGTSYLGMTHHPEFREWVKKGIDAVGVHFGGSRLSNVQLSVFDQAEDFLAKKCGVGSALIVSSGSFAGYVSSLLISKGKDSALVAPGTHSAFSAHFNGSSVSTRSDWEKRAQGQIGRKRTDAVVVTNSIDPLFCRPIQMDWLREVSPDRHPLVVVDDSHGIGVCGSHGEGHCRMWGDSRPEKFIFAGSLGKAVGIPAGFIIGSKNHLDRLRTKSIYGGSSPANPAFLYAFIRSEEIRRHQLKKLRANIRYFLDQLKAPELFNYLSDYPVFCTADHGLYDHLRKHKIIISSFNYPGKEDPKVTRIVINAMHTEEDLDELVFRINEYTRSI